MYDDEDLIVNDSPFHEYLKEIGFLENINLLNNVSHSQSSNLTSDSVEKPSGKESLSTQSRQLLKTLIDSSLLFEHDIVQILDLIPEYNEKSKYLNKLRRAMFNHMFHLPFITVIGLILYLLVGGYAFFLLATYYSYKTADFLYLEKAQIKLIEGLLTRLRSNYKQISHVIEFTKLRPHPELCSVLVTQHNYLVQCFNAELKNLKHCHKSVENHHEGVKMSLIEYLTVQSQFLSALYLKHFENPVIVVSAIKNITKSLREVNVNLNRSYRAALVESRPITQLKTNEKSNPFYRHIHDLGNRVQMCLTGIRELEEKLEDEHFVIDFKLSSIVSELNALSKQAAVIEVMNNNRLIEKSNDKVEKSFIIKEASLNLVEVGQTILDPVVEDDVFEIESNPSSSSEEMNFNNDFDFLTPNPLPNVHNQVLKELKEKIKTRDWSQREAEVFRKKYPDKIYDQAEINDHNDDNDDERRDVTFENLTSNIREKNNVFISNLISTRNALLGGIGLQSEISFCENETESEGSN